MEPEFSCFKLLPFNNSFMKEMYVIANRKVSMRDKRFSYAKVGTLRLSLSKASLRLNILRRSRMLAARRWANVATLLLVFFWIDALELPDVLRFTLKKGRDSNNSNSSNIWYSLSITYIHTWLARFRCYIENCHSCVCKYDSPVLSLMYESDLNANMTLRVVGLRNRRER